MAGWGSMNFQGCKTKFALEQYIQKYKVLRQSRDADGLIGFPEMFFEIFLLRNNMFSVE